MPTNRRRVSRHRVFQGLEPHVKQWLTGIPEPDANTFGVLDFELTTDKHTHRRKGELLAAHADDIEPARLKQLRAELANTTFPQRSDDEKAV